jgi:hypothetical protein
MSLGFVPEHLRRVDDRPGCNEYVFRAPVAAR